MATAPAPSWSHGSISGAAPLSSPVQAQANVQLSDLEWSIVAMAERDGLASLRKPNGFWSLISLLFGVKPANRLANDRLEALRRLAVLAWRYRWNVARSELDAFFAAGFSPAQYELILRKISAVRAGKRGRHSR